MQRQLQHITAREAGLQAEVVAYKLEHTQLLAANKQLMAQCTGLNREVQVRSVYVTAGANAEAIGSRHGSIGMIHEGLRTADAPVFEPAGRLSVGAAGASVGGSMLTSAALRCVRTGVGAECA